MLESRTAVWPLGGARHALRRATSAATRNIRLTVILSLVLIGGSFASAGAIQLRLDRGRALDEAGRFETRRAQEIAADFASTLNRYAALATAFANADNAEATATLSEAGGRALQNIVILDSTGQVVSQMKGPPRGLLPLSQDVLTRAQRTRIAIPGAQPRSLTLLVPLGANIAAVQIDLRALLRPASMDEAVLATEGGRILDLGSRWKEAPPIAALRLVGGSPVTRVAESGGERRLVALAPVLGWPVVAGASIRTGDALSSWYASLPLFLFVIIGPALAGAGLAVVFVREFERRARAADAVKRLKATSEHDARLLIRLAEAERRAVEAERSKSEFVAHMSHELRTPLNAIIGFSEVIAENYLGNAAHPKYAEYAKDIAGAGRRLHNKISDILDFANLEAGRYPIECRELDLAQTTRIAVGEVSALAQARGIRLTVSLPASAFALADARAVRRVLTNLLVNALTYTPEGGAVRIAVRNEDDAVIAAVRDNGLGFTQDEQDRAGRAFTRFSRSGAETGIGMGIAIAMALAHRMGGAVRITGEPGEGATAELHLRRA